MGCGVEEEEEEEEEAEEDGAAVLPLLSCFCCRLSRASSSSVMSSACSSIRVGLRESIVTHVGRRGYGRGRSGERQSTARRKACCVCYPSQRLLVPVVWWQHQRRQPCLKKARQ